MTLKITEVPVSKVNIIRAAITPGGQMENILRRAKRLPIGRALKIRAGKEARKIAARLSFRAKYHNIPVKCGFRGGIVFVWKVRKAKAAAKAPAAAPGEAQTPA